MPMRTWLVLLAILGGNLQILAAPVLTDSKGKEIRLWKGGLDQDYVLPEPAKMEPLYRNLTLGPIILESDSVRSADEVAWSCSLINTSETTEELEIPAAREKKNKTSHFWVGHCAYKVEKIAPAGMDVAKYKAPQDPNTYDNPGAIPAGHSVVHVHQKRSGGLTGTFKKVDEINWSATALFIRPKESILIAERSPLGGRKLGNGTYELAVYYCTLDGRLLAVRRAVFSIGAKLRNSQAEAAKSEAKGK